MQTVINDQVYITELLSVQFSCHNSIVTVNRWFAIKLYVLLFIQLKASIYFNKISSTVIKIVHNEGNCISCCRRHIIFNNGHLKTLNSITLHNTLQRNTTQSDITVCTVVQDCCKGRSDKYRKWHFWGSCRPETP